MAATAESLPTLEQRSSTGVCYHCGLPIPAGVLLQTAINGVLRPMCCHGCLAVAEAIVQGGHGHYYRTRTELPISPADAAPEFLLQSPVYDNAAIQREFVDDSEAGRREVELAIDGITCSACIWLIERHLVRLPGVESAVVNYATYRARVAWNDDVARLSQIVDSLQSIGYRAYPYKASEQSARMAREYRQSLRWLVIAGIFGMQVMMLAIALYLAGDTMDERYATLFRWASLLLCAPILTYSASSFFRAAYNQIAARIPGMDVPVSLGIGIAFVASALATVIGRGEIYFDSIAMFTFLLLLARHVELLARRRANETALCWQHAMPSIANRREENGEYQQVAAIQLRVGDRVRVLPGETIPADGQLQAGEGEVDESLLTGESLPIPKTVGDSVIGGSVVLDQVLELKVTATTDNSFAAQLRRLLSRVQSEKPPLVQLADKVAGIFVSVVLIVCALIAVYWHSVGASHWLAITVATLIATCPCALSLATPTVITAASGALADMGLLVTRGGAIETLARITHVVFDKTGTLTDGELHLCDVALHGDIDKAAVMRIASALSQQSRHPVAAAIQQYFIGDLPAVCDVQTSNGGLSGSINGQRWYFGNADYLLAIAGVRVPTDCRNDAHGRSVSTLLSGNHPVATFYFSHQVRTGAAALVDELHASQIKVTMLSGDGADAVRHIARETDINDLRYRQSPEQKLTHIRRLQASGAVVAMIGDGNNDSPALRCADVSVAMGAGADLAKTSADAVLLANTLPALISALRIARRSCSVIRQNIAWAIGYNAVALPLAASGFLTPWMAAIGMSLSSLLVVLNASRMRSGK